MSNIVQSTTHLLQGAQEIERAIKQRLLELGAGPAPNFRWHHGKPLDPVPSRFQWHPGKPAVPVPTGGIELQVVGHNGNRSNAIVSREQLLDSWSRVDRADVVRMVDTIAQDLARQPTD